MVGGIPGAGGPARVQSCSGTHPEKAGPVLTVGLEAQIAVSYWCLFRSHSQQGRFSFT